MYKTYLRFLAHITTIFFACTLAVHAKHKSEDLEYFSYCSNGQCRLINGNFFHDARDMPIDLNVSCKKNNQYALTFDDGPTQNYPRLLEILKRNNVKATFFIVGSHLQNEERVNWFRQAFKDGHFMANHTYQHEDLTQLDEASMIETVEKTRLAMMNALTSDESDQLSRLEISSRVVRPPFGNINMVVDNIFKNNQYVSVRWNADRYDWNMPGDDPKTSQVILDRVRDQFKFISNQIDNGKQFNQSILDLNHDGQLATIEAIQELIDYVKSKGYQFVTMDECLGM